MQWYPPASHGRSALKDLWKEVRKYYSVIFNLFLEMLTFLYYIDIITILQVFYWSLFDKRDLKKRFVSITRPLFTNA